MLRTLVFIVKLVILVALAIWLANWEGRVAFDLPAYGIDLWVFQASWPDYRVDIPVGLLLLPVLVLWFLAVLYVWGWRSLRRAPGRLGEMFEGGRKKRGYQALTQGMVAVAAGDAGEAQRWARKADSLLNEPPLTMLLSAQAAQLDGDEQAARRYFEAMLEREETRFLGLRGLLMQAMRENDEKAALGYARQAYAMRPKTPWVLDTLFDLSERNGDLEAAERALREASKRKQLPAAEVGRKRAVLLTERAQAARAGGDRETARKLAKEAHKLSPELVPATALLAELLVESGSGREAMRLLERSWAAAPHPDLVAIYKRARAGKKPGADDGIGTLQSLERLVAGAADDPESRLALAEAALQAKLWGEARRYVADSVGADGALPGERACHLMARLEEAEHGDGVKAREWWLKAGEAPADPAWVCGNCGAVAQGWAARCGACHSFDSLAWTPPPRVAAQLAPAEVVAIEARQPQAADGAAAGSLPVPVEVPPEAVTPPAPPAKEAAPSAR